MPASSIELNLSYLREYLKLDPHLRTVFVELFVYNFRGAQKPADPQSFSEFLHNTTSLFLSTDALWDSLVTLDYNLVTNAPHQEIKPGGYFYYPPGLDPKPNFDAYPHGWWRPGMGSTKLEIQEAALDTIDQFVALCREKNIELKFIVTSNYAYDDYYIELIGAWDTICDWLKRISAEADVYSFSNLMLGIMSLSLIT